VLGKSSDLFFPSLGTGNCNGAVNGANGQPIEVPCTCPPDRNTFIQVTFFPPYPRLVTPLTETCFCSHSTQTSPQGKPSITLQSPCLSPQITPTRPRLPGSRLRSWRCKIWTDRVKAARLLRRRSLYVSSPAACSRNVVFTSVSPRPNLKLFSKLALKWWIGLN